jgi:predicted membrane GTPase involved in stress response
VIGENPKTDDLVVNINKTKQLTNMRARVPMTRRASRLR